MKNKFFYLKNKLLTTNQQYILNRFIKTIKLGTKST